jgi:hypothetical protein
MMGAFCLVRDEIYALYNKMEFNNSSHRKAEFRIQQKRRSSDAISPLKTYFQIEIYL